MTLSGGLRMMCAVLASIHNPVLEISAGRAGVKHNACRSWRFYLDVESMSRFGH